MKVLQMPRRHDGEAMGEGRGTGSVLPQVWATDGSLAHAVLPLHAESGADQAASPSAADAAVERERSTPVFRVVLAPQTAFYRRYTEAMLRRYGVLSTESGRVPSLMGRELFRGRVTSHRMHGFDDVVIFVHDVEQCVCQLTPEQQRLLLRIGVQEYTFAETAAMLRLSLRSIQRRYREALDELTAIFLERRLMERITGNSCQEGGGSAVLVSHSAEETYA